MARKYKGVRTKAKVSGQEWQDLALNQRLSGDFARLSQEMQRAHAEAVQKAARMGGTIDDYIDLSVPLQRVKQNPALLRYLSDVAGQVGTVPYTSFDLDSQKGTPTGHTPGRADSYGGWSTNKNMTDSVVNARILRDWADSSEWVRAAINVRRQQIGRANVAVVPFNERRGYNRKLTKQVQLLLDQPNEYRQNYYELMSSCADDLLVLDRGCILKDMTVDRKPVHIYNEDGACIKIYPDWTGKPKEPRYLYESPASSIKVPLRNDECIVMMANPATYRFGLSPVQVLRNTIQADLTATRSAMLMVDLKPPPHMIQLPGATQGQLDAIRSKYESDIAGRKEIFWLGGQTQAQAFPLVFSAKDNQWLEWQVYLARKIAVVFQISPQQLGITFDINKATASSQQEIFEDTGLIPLLLLVEEYFNRELLGDFAPAYPDGRVNLDALNLRILYPEVTEADRQMHAERAVKLATTGLAGLPSMTLNQVLALFGQEPVDGGNTFYVSTTNGPIAWLSYDKKATGDYGSSSTSGALGAQDSAGGPDTNESGMSAASDDSNYDGPDTPGGQSGQGDIQNPGQAEASFAPGKIKEQRNFGKRWTTACK